MNTEEVRTSRTPRETRSARVATPRRPRVVRQSGRNHDYESSGGTRDAGRARASRVARVARLRLAVAAGDRGSSALAASRRNPRARGGGRGAVSPPRRLRANSTSLASRTRSISGQSLTPSPLAPRASPPTPTHAQPVEATPADDTAEAVVESVVEAGNSEEVRATPLVIVARFWHHAPRGHRRVSAQICRTADRVFFGAWKNAIFRERERRVPRDLSLTFPPFSSTLRTPRGTHRRPLPIRPPSRSPARLSSSRRPPSP